MITHYFWPEVEYCYRLTHDVPTICYDTSGLADDEVVAATGMDKIRTVLIDTLRDGPERVVFGTDYAMCDRLKHIELIRSLPISAQVREQVFWRNAIQLFQLNIARPVEYMRSASRGTAVATVKRGGTRLGRMPRRLPLLEVT